MTQGRDELKDSGPGVVAPSSLAGRSGAGVAEETTAQAEGTRLWGLLAEFLTVEDLLRAAEQMRDTGFKKWDAHAPFPVHGLNDAMGLGYPKLPVVVLFGGLTGGGLALLMQWWMNSVSYPLWISGKPLFSVPANIPVFFELTILFSAITAFVGMLAFNGLPRHHHALFASERFRRVTQDRFFISVEASDPKFDPATVMEFLECLGSVHVERIEEED